jgi:hypothetical protein
MKNILTVTAKTRFIEPEGIIIPAIEHIIIAAQKENAHVRIPSKIYHFL